VYLEVHFPTDLNVSCRSNLNFYFYLLRSICFFPVFAVLLLICDNLAWPLRSSQACSHLASWSIVRSHGIRRVGDYRDLVLSICVSTEILHVDINPPLYVTSKTVGIVNHAPFLSSCNYYVFLTILHILLNVVLAKSPGTRCSKRPT
jgi:hypothetical protein